MGAVAASLNRGTPAALAACLALIAGGSAEAGLIDPCLRSDTTPEPYAEALTAAGWQASEPGPEADAALLGLIAAYDIPMTFRVPTTAAEAARALEVARHDAEVLFATARVFRREGATFALNVVANPDQVTVVCIAAGEPLSEIDGMGDRMQLSPAVKNVRYLLQKPAQPSATSADISWFRFENLPLGSGIPADTIIYTATFPAAK